MLNGDYKSHLPLWTCRTLCLIGAAALPATHVLFHRAHAELLDPLWPRLVLGAMALALLGASFVSAQVRKELSGLTIVVGYVVLIWFTAVAYVNGLPAAYALASLPLLVGVAMVAGTGQSRLLALACALVTATAALLTIAFVVPEPGVDRAIYSGAVLASSGGLFAIAWGQGRLRRRLRESGERYRTIFERVADGVLLVDPKTMRPIASNYAYRQITGFSNQDVTSRRLHDLLVARPNEIDGFVRRATKEGSIDLGELHHHRRDGSRVPVSASLALVPDERHQLLCLTVHDLSEANRVRAEIEAARDQAQAMLELRNDFLNNMSHEMRTPLISLTGFLSIMEEEYDTIDRDEAEAMVASLRRSADRLSQTLNAVLDLAQLEAGHHDFDVQVVDVNIAARDALQLVMAEGVDKGLEFDIETGEPASIQADPQALHRILTNILSNAVKFTPSGRVSVAVEADSHRVLLRIQDTGVGIQPEFMPFLFGAFRQASTGLGREHEGTGLGLTIAKRLLDAMGGRIHVDSAPGEGTTITLAFARTWATPSGVFEPSALAGSTPPIAAQASAASGDGHVSASIEPLAPRPRVLIVEDNDDTARLMERMLARDFDVNRCSDAECALDRARGAWFDVLLIDIHLGDGMDGVTLLGRLRAMSAYAHVPAVAITTSTGNDSPERCFAGGYDAYLAKPFTRKQLLKVMHEAQHARMMASA